MTAAPRVSTEETLTWQLVHAAPGALFYTAPAVGTPIPSRHREQEWTPADSLDEPAGAHPDEPEHQSALDYASHIGRVGLLAAALGLGAAIARSPGIASAEPTDGDSTASSSESESSTSEPAETPAPSMQSGPASQRGTTTTSGQPSASSRSQTSTPTSGSQTSVSVTAPGSSSPPAVVRSSGGAHTTSPRSGAAADTAHEAAGQRPAPAVEKSGQQPAITPEASTTPDASSTTPGQTETPPAESAAPAPQPEQLGQQPAITPEPSAAPAPNPAPAAPTAATRPHRQDTTASPTPGHSGAQGTAPASPHPPAAGRLDQSAPHTSPAAPAARPDAASMRPSAPTAPATTAGTEPLPALPAPTLPAAVPPPANVVSSLLGTLGLAPLGTTSTAAPVVEPPASWGVLDWARRQKHPTASPTTTTAEPTQTSLVEPALSYTVAGGPAHGTITITPDGNYTYTPTATDAGAPAAVQNTFTVTVSDTHGASTTVPVTAATDTSTNASAHRLILSHPDGATDAVHVLITPTDPITDQFGHLVLHNPSYGTTARVTYGGSGGIATSTERPSDTFGIQTAQVDKSLTTTGAMPVAAAVTPAPTAAIATAPTTVIGWVTGERAPNYTSSRFGIAGADLGIMWDNGVKDNPATLVDEHQILMAFGDTFSGTGQTGIWRMNTLLRSSDHVLSNGMTVADGSTTDPFAGAPLVSANLSKQIIGSPGYAVGSEVTIIPTAGISVPYNNAYGARQYVNFMSVRSWDSAGRWTTNYSGIAYSDDNGQTWTVARSSIRPAATGRSTLPYVSGNQNFQQGAYVKGVTLDATGKPVYDANGQLVTDGYVYSYGTASGRGGTVYLSRVKQADILDQTKYEYWNGSAWVLNKPSAAVPVLPGTTTGFWFFRQTTYPSVSEMSVQYNTYLNKYVLMYCDNNNNVVIRTATKPQGPWSAPTTLVTSTQYPGLYAPMMNPWSGTAQVKGPDGVTPEDPKYLYWNLSMWGDYNVQSMRTDLSALKT